MGPFSFSQLKVGGGKPVASQERDTKLFTTTVTVSGFRPIMVGGTKSKAKWKYIYMSKLETAVRHFKQQYFLHDSKCWHKLIYRVNGNSHVTHREH